MFSFASCCTQCSKDVQSEAGVPAGQGQKVGLRKAGPANLNRQSFIGGGMYPGQEMKGFTSQNPTAYNSQHMNPDSSHQKEFTAEVATKNLPQNKKPNVAETEPSQKK